MKSLKYRLKKHEVTITNTDWNKYDDRLMKAVERREVDKVAAVLGKKGIIPTKLDVEGRSAFHLAATRGHLDCLNLILHHGVDVTATDATGKNALHLAARNSQSLCVQKLLQHNCPVGNVDLQGRTALHDAVMAGCSSSVKLLCDSGASVNASDFDGRTPLVLATQMCHPHICQLLLDRGSDITVRDKQNKTALILGCEYACKDAVEVLLKNAADVTAIDGFGYDSYHYARLSKNQELVSLVKSYLDIATKAKEAAKMEQKRRQDLEKQNESQQETLKKFHQEQRTLLDKVNMLQQQLSQEKSTVEDIHKEREQLKLLLSAKEKEEGARAMETVRVQQRSLLGDYPGQSVIKGKENMLVRQSHSLDSAQILQPRVPSQSVTRPLELSRPIAGDPETLRQELESVRRQQEAAQVEVGHLQMALARKSQECEELTRRCDTIKRESDQQVHELEEAMGDVQKRMLDSEAKVKQLQAHVVAVKEHLNNQAVEDLKAQLTEVKAKYEGASAEVGRVRNHLKQSEKALEEYKKSEGLLAVEVEKLTTELSEMQEEHKDMEETMLNMEGQVKMAEVRLASMVPGEKFDNMKNLLTNAVDEKEQQLAELRDDYDRVLEEVAELHRAMDDRESVPLQEHERVRATLEEQSASLKKKLADVTAKCQSLICELEEGEDERELLREELQELSNNLKTKFVALENHEEVKRSMGLAVEELRVRLVEETEKSKQAEVQLRRLQEEKAFLCENITSLRSTSIPCEQYESEIAALLGHNAELKSGLESLHDKYQEKVNELEIAAAENVSLKTEYERVQTELGEALQKAKIEIAKLEEDCRVREEELQKVKEGNAMLKEEFANVQAKLENDYISLVEHEVIKSKMSNDLSEAEGRARDAYSKYQSARENASKLHEEIEAQKKELDTIQEAFQSKFVPLAVVEEKEMNFSTAQRDLSDKLAKMLEMYNDEKTKGECQRQENEKFKEEVASLQQKLEDHYKGQLEERSLKLVEMEQQYKEVTIQRAELEEQNALCNTELQSLQNRLDNEYIHLEQFEAMQHALSGRLQEAQKECEDFREAHRLEVQRVHDLEKRLQNHSCDDVLNAQYSQAKVALEHEVNELRLALQEEEETSAQRAEDVATLQTELLRATHALDNLRSQEGQMTELKAEKHRLEEEVHELGHRLSGLDEQYEELYRESAQAREGEKRARAETEAQQVKSASIEKEIRDLKERYDKSLGTIGELQKRIQASSEQTELKDKRIAELLADVERLKQALNGLSQLAYAGNTPNKRQTQHIDTLQAQVKSLQQQLADAERQHREVVSIYRTHLLSAAQGHMDEDVQAALLQIIRMRQGFVC
ncbi:uveal autoantigen with coiled-coil domains and ankyrin repeats protein-like [Myxocyprinus asiaticus]|uniref:uveal autoantigen with coiled-coil domains and ankyrin repeats protein-like n=1 Tax=Myxocyprinus asiaticus TaxID=70543 RepID=UPI0022232DB8|nr:uveal autoantigen with coiled-coil domains and ankyrin repeats protein-like [Myxocyprinus asiaticus]XP_051560934.1 uveal autoantigen with coiled-coil domains and ankyrin repeats protein-like [Myxocyprinus asiaticus]